jgi:hypothetical protein
MRKVKLAGMTALFAAVIATAPPVSGQYPEIEPNQPCSDAQRLDADPGLLAAEIRGEVTQDADSDPPGDMDYFRFQAGAGTALRADLLAGEATSPLGFVPYLGLFDDQCGALDFDAYHYGIDARVDFTVPNSGQFVLGVNSVTDLYWSGQHGQAGFYILRVAQPEPPIGGIGGRLVDAVTGDPLLAGIPRWPYVALFRCRDGECTTPVKYENVDQDGRFLIESGELGPLDPGEYLLQAFAVEYEAAFVGPFAVWSDEVKDLGDIALQPPEFAFGAISPCAALGPEGGQCSYSVKFSNNGNSGAYVRSWSLVQAVQDDQGFHIPFVEFPAHPRFRKDWVDARSTVTLNFSFRVPPATPDHLYAICPQALAADAATQFTGVLAWSQLFCVIKQRPGFDVLARRQVLQLDGLGAWWREAELRTARAARAEPAVGSDAD